MTYRIAPGVALVEARNGPALLSSVPLRLVTLNGPLAELLRGRGGTAPRSPASARALEALHRRGMLVRDLPVVPAPGALPRVSVVVPVRDRAEALRRCLLSVNRLQYPRDRLEVLVVDDGSSDAGPALARLLGATVLSSGGQGRGPAAARNVGARAASGDLLAFLDSDCVASERWLVDIVPVFSDPCVAAVGGRVEGMRSSSLLDRYEAAMSSLSLGGRGRCAQLGSDTFYLPGCNLLVRRTAFHAVGGFREELHVGEDVDLCWRLRDGGDAIAYVARGAVQHEHRNRLGSFLRRRFEYGGSEAPLHALHPGRRKRFVVPPALLVAALLAVAAPLAGAWPLAVLGAAAVALDALRLWALLRRRISTLSLGRVVGARARAAASLLYHAAYHLVRYYAPALALASLAWPRFALVTAALVVGPAAVDYAVKRPALSFPAFLAIYLAEHLVYGAGVFRGCLRQRTFRSYRPEIARDLA
jgi:mycofactocin system glycosyltransferase